MFAVIFQVYPKPDRWDQYLALAASLKPALEAIDGFMGVERFKSLDAGGHILSFSTWRDQAAVIAWRNHGGHKEVQALGRSDIFQDYRLRVGEDVPAGDPASDPAGRYVTVDDASHAGAQGPRVYESIYTPGKRIALTSGVSGGGGVRFRIIRDYGMFAREEAPGMVL